MNLLRCSKKNFVRRKIFQASIFHFSANILLLTNILFFTLDESSSMLYEEPSTSYNSSRNRHEYMHTCFSNNIFLAQPSTSSTSGPPNRRQRNFFSREKYRQKKIEVLERAAKTKADYYAAKLKLMERALEERKEGIENKKAFLKNLFEV